MIPGDFRLQIPLPCYNAPMPSERDKAKRWRPRWHIRDLLWGKKITHEQFVKEVAERLDVLPDEIAGFLSYFKGEHEPVEVDEWVMLIEEFYENGLPPSFGHPELLNEDAFEEGWLVKLRPESSKPLTALLDAKDYKAIVGNAG